MSPLQVLALVSVGLLQVSSGIKLAAVKTIKGPGKCDFWWYKPQGAKLFVTATVPVGTTCSWTWDDDASHCVTPNPNNPDKNLPNKWVWQSPDGNPQLQGMGQVYKHKFTTPGFFKFLCCNHLNLMKGTINVTKGGGTPKPSPSPPPKASPKPSPKLSPPPPCKGGCGGKCWGVDGCQKMCPFPASKKLTDCKMCCAKGRPNGNKAVLLKCVADCQK